jgi:hypothetical protein
MGLVRSVAGATVAVVLCSTLSHAGDDVFGVHMKDVERNEESAAGRLYFPAFQKEFGTGYAPRINECAKRTGGPQSAPFDVLMKLGASGKVEKALVRPSTPFSECFTALSKKATFPRPPSPGYWVAARMRFTQQ